MICRGMLTPNTLMFLTANAPAGVTTLHSAFSPFRRGGRVEAEMVGPSDSNAKVLPLLTEEQVEEQKHHNIYLRKALDCLLRR